MLIVSFFAIPVNGQLVNNEENEVGLQSENSGLGVFVNLDTNNIQFIDPVTKTVSDHKLKGKLGTYEGGLLDVAITNDGTKALVSNFWDGLVFIIDISGGFDAEPVILGQVFCQLPPEDIAITPDDKYALVTDGDGWPFIAVIDIEKMELVMVRDMPCLCLGVESVTIAADGKTVIATDYNGAYVHVLMLNEGGKLRYVDSYDIWPFWPVNSTVSPDGKTVIVSLAFHGVAPTYSIDYPGKLTFKGRTKIPASSGQSCVFSHDGTKAYYVTNDPTKRGSMIHELEITGPGEVMATGMSMNVHPTRGDGGLFGVDTIAIDPSGQYLYFTNPTDNNAIQTVEIIDIATFTQIKLLKAKGYPLGISFTGQNSSEERKVNPNNGR
jgi:DNA-binding beta-propeller fold protein YncE